MARPTRAIINLEAIRQNYRLAKKVSSSKAMAIIKANAYGHGAVPVAKALADEADAFGVACLEEALEIRESGIKQPLLLLEGVFTPDELVAAGRLNFPVTVHSDQQLQWLLEASLTKPLDVFLKLDTGMHRLGFAPARARELLTKLRDCPHVGSVTLMTHFARADEVDETFTSTQIQRFLRAISDLRPPVSIANSAGILAWPVAHGDWVRPGIMLYGSGPLSKPNQHSRLLKPAMTLESELIAVRTLEAGESIGYGGRFRCEESTRVGVVALGYADGYPRHAMDGTPVKIEGLDSRIIGQVSMDMLTVDLTEVPDARIGSKVELWGNQVLANAVATCSDTISYTLFTGITNRVPRFYLDN